ncbi:hypothetical protein KC19_1G032100 [Ceratodon purpureus]|uniref:Uncharacterized protein n=1 Tax=Ceratodon purpureus TaxID=3225 RepID=A0A8T0J226_CERPU|nr:hypothetical protein KC19_1G032100 [Ceratodon purpureus]
MVRIMFKWIRDLFEFLLAMIIVMVMSGSECVAMAARTDPVELQAVYATMVATGNDWVTSIPDVCVKSGRWHGIECEQDGEFFHVVGLSFGLVTDHSTAFPACGTDSTISPAVANLTHLRKLSYFGCCTANPQPIPSEIGLLSATLETLHLRSNGHVGALPPELATLTKLQTFDVRRNTLTGKMPIWLSSLTQLQVVDMSDNSFEGELDAASFFNLERLVILDASANRLVGTLPDSIGQLKALKKLDLSNNNLTGAIPATVGDLSNLLTLNLAQNALTGPLPTSLGGLEDLKSLDLSRNRFREPIPDSFGSLRSLDGLVLSGAEFTGAIPSSLGSLRNLRALFLDGNKLTGAIPPALAGLDRVYELGLNGNLLSGPVPFSASFVSRLGRRLRLQNNDGLCYEFQAAKSLTSGAEGSLTIRPADPHPLLQICTNSGKQRADPPSDSERPSPVVPSTGSWNPAFESSSSCSQASAFQAAKHVWFFVVLIGTVSRW